MSSRTIDVDTKTFIRFWVVILGFALAALFIWKALTGLIIVGISIFLAIAIRPLAERIDSIDKKKKRPTLSTVLAFALVVVVLGVIIAVIGPTIINETSKFIKQIPDAINNTFGGWDGINEFGKTFGIENLQTEISTYLANFAANLGTEVVASLGAIVSTVASGVMVLVLTLLFLLEGPAMLDGFWKMLSGKRRDESVEEARRVVSRMGQTISGYVSRQATVALIDGVSVAVVVAILSFIFGFSTGLAFPMGLLAFIAYLIPMFGQVIGCVLIALVLLFNAPVAMIVYVAFYALYAQVENNWISPKLQGDALSLPPVVILVAITIGTYMFGLLGAIIAIPVAGCIKVLCEEYPRIKELQEKN